MGNKPEEYLTDPDDWVGIVGHDAGSKLKLEPFEDRVIILPDTIDDTLGSGLLVKAKDTKVSERRNATNGIIAAISDCAFTDWDGKKPVMGDRVVFSRHAGQFYVEDDLEYRIMRDSEVIGIIKE